MIPIYVCMYISPEAWYSRRSQYQLITGIPRILIKPMENHHSRDALGHHEIPYKTNGKPSFPRFHVIRFETTSRLPQALVRWPPRTARYQVWEHAFHFITKHLATLKPIGKTNLDAMPWGIAFYLIKPIENDYFLCSTL